MGLVVGAAAVAVALAHRGAIARVRAVGGVLPRLGGAVLLLAGGYVAWYGFWELRVLAGGAGRDPVIEAAGTVQRWLADGVEAVGASGFVAALAVLVLASVLLARRRGGQSRRGG